MSRITTLLFDFGNVIIDIDIPGAKERISALRNPDISERDFESEIIALIKKYEVDAISEGVFINGILKLSDKGIQARDVVNAWNSMLIGIPEYRLTMLEQLRRDYSVYLLSNTNSLHIDWVYNHLLDVHNVVDFDKRYFDGTFYSHVIRERKPDQSCFQYVIDETFITPTTTLFVDDTPENLESAQLMGFRTLHSPAEDEIAETLKLEGFF